MTNNERVLPALWGKLSESQLRVGRSRWLAAVLAACFIVRLGVACALPNIHQADEIFQVSEQATRAARGFGIVSWEFQTASRPALLAAVATPIYALPVSPAAHQTLLAALLCALSLLPVWVAFRWAEHLHGATAGVIAAVIVGTWFELVYFAPKATADVLCAYFFVAAIFLGRPMASTRSVFLAGGALMLSLGIRMQILPAVTVIGVVLVVTHRRQHAGALIGGLACGLAAVGAVEWAWWGAPFRGHWGYLQMEFSRHASDLFGREPATFFVKNAVLFYGGTLPVIAALAYAGARRAPLLLLAAIALALPFHFVGHKEYRFMLPALTTMTVLMALGASDAMSRLSTRPARTAWAAVAAGWLVAMAAMAWGDAYRPYWLRDRDQILAFREIGAQPDACGVALDGIRWWHTPGYAGLGRDIPIYELRGEEAGRLVAAANYIVSATKAAPPPAPYERWREYARPLQYVYRRPGGCSPDPAAKIERPPIPVGVP